MCLLNGKEPNNAKECFKMYEEDKLVANDLYKQKKFSPAIKKYRAVSDYDLD